MSEHPDDRKCRLEGELRANKRRAKRFVADNPAKIRQLFRTYSEEDAISLLANLRESFWNYVWEDEDV